MRRQGFGLVTVLTLLTLAGGRGAYAAEPPTIIVTIQ